MLDMEKETDNEDLKNKLRQDINKRSNERKRKFRTNLKEEEKAVRKLLDADPKIKERKLAKANDSTDVKDLKRKIEREKRFKAKNRKREKKEATNS